jgi:2-phospho-L-lactate/phosphoenolpyruvate guanylyltransferase
MIKTFAIIPVKKFENSKTRLSTLLNIDERVQLSALMLDDTLSALAGAKSLHQVVVVSCDRRAEEIAARHGAKFLHEEKESGVNSAVELADRHCTDQGADATVVIPQDLPLLDAFDVDAVCGMAQNENGSCIVICPSLRYDGTNLLLRKPPSAIKTYYDNDSYESHVKAASKLGITVKLYFSKKLMTDIDTPEDARQLAKEAGSGKTIEFIRFKLKI